MTKTLKISRETAASIEEAISTSAGRKKAFVHTAADIIAAAERAEERLEALGLPKTHRTGATAVFVLEGPGKSYRYTAEGTHVYMTRKAGGWVIDAIKLGPVYPGAAARLDVTITADQHAAAIAAQLRDLKIRIAPATAHAVAAVAA